jgi:capsular polysaccharide transport system permease protein
MVDFVNRAQAIARGATAIAGARPIITASVVRYLRSLNIWFWAIVGLPTLIAGVYYFAIASDLYLSEVKFVVRSPSKGAMSSITSMLSSAGAASVSEDTFAVHEYLMSRDAVRRLEQEDDLRTLLSRPEGDSLTRFPGFLFWRHDFEALFRS